MRVCFDRWSILRGRSPRASALRRFWCKNLRVDALFLPTPGSPEARIAPLSSGQNFGLSVETNVGGAAALVSKCRFRIASVNSANEILVRDIVGGDLLEPHRSVVPIVETGAGKTHLAIAIACIRAGARGRFFNGVDLVYKVEARVSVGRRGA